MTHQVNFAIVRHRAPTEGNETFKSLGILRAVFRFLPDLYFGSGLLLASLSRAWHAAAQGACNEKWLTGGRPSRTGSAGGRTLPSGLAGLAWYSHASGLVFPCGLAWYSHAGLAWYSHAKVVIPE